MGAQHWAPGTHIVSRSMWKGRVVAAWPCIVVADSPQATVLYAPAGSTFKLRTGVNPRLPIGEWEHVDLIWRSAYLRIMYPGDSHAYLAFWENGTFDRW